MTFLQGKAEDGKETSSQGRCAQSDGSARGSSSGAGASSRAAGTGSAASTAGRRAGSGAGGLGGRTVGGLVEGGVTALAVAGLGALELLSSVALAISANGGVDASIVPEVAHLGGDGLLVGLHGILGDGGAVGAAALVVERGLRVALAGCYETSVGRTYSVAGVAVAGNVTLATAEVDAGVLLGVTP